jgi:hypothetical protein
MCPPGAGGISLTGSRAPKYLSASANTSAADVSPATVRTALFGA